MTFDDALAIVTTPTPAQEWLASVRVPEADPAEEPRDVYEQSIIRLASFHSGAMECRIEGVTAGDTPEERCSICGTEDCEGCLVECDLDAYKRYRDLYEDETLL